MKFKLYLEPIEFEAKDMGDAQKKAAVMLTEDHLEYSEILKLKIGMITEIKK